MPEPLPDLRLRRVLEQVDQLKKELRAERIRASNLKTRLEKAQRIAAGRQDIRHASVSWEGNRWRRVSGTVRGAAGTGGKKMAWRILFFDVVFALVISLRAADAQVKIDLSSEDARKAAGELYLDDLAVHDTAFIRTYEASYCIKDGGLYLLGYSTPTDLSKETSISGIILRIEVLPGKKVKAVLVDAAQARQPDRYPQAIQQLLPC